MLLSDKQLLSVRNYYHSLSLLTCLDHWLQGLLIYALPTVLATHHPECDFYQHSVWLYGTWIATYATKPIGILYFHHFLIHHNIRKTLIYTNTLWLISSFCIMFTPLLHLPLFSIGCIFFLSRCLGHICIAGENTLARTLLVNIPSHTTRLQKNRFYERAVIAGYFLSLVSSYALPWMTTMAILLVLGLLCLVQRHKNTQLPHIHLPDLQTHHHPPIFYIFLASGICFSYLAYAVGINYIYPLHPQPLYMAGIFLWNMGMLTVCPKNVRITHKRNIILFSIFAILLGIYCLIFYPLHGHLLLSVQLWTISYGILFEVYFFSYIKHLYPSPIDYLSLGFLGWGASLIYGKYLPWLLLMHTQSHNLVILTLITALIALPSTVILASLLPRRPRID